jgi:hypothetical protein
MYMCIHMRTHTDGQIEHMSAYIVREFVHMKLAAGRVKCVPPHPNPFLPRSVKTHKCKFYDIHISQK